MGKTHVKKALAFPKAMFLAAQGCLGARLPNKAARVNTEQAFNQVVPVSVSYANWLFSYQPHGSESTGGNLWLLSNYTNNLCVCSGLLIQVSVDHQQTTFTSACCFLNKKLHPCTRGCLCHRKGREGRGWDEQLETLETWVSWSHHTHYGRRGVPQDFHILLSSSSCYPTYPTSAVRLAR